MASIQDVQPKNITKIDNFLGLNLNGDTQLKLGESGNMNNCYITDNYDLSKMYGYKAMMSTIGITSSVRGVWKGVLDNTNQFLIACNGHIYKVDNGYWNDDSSWDDEDFTNHTTDLGTLTDAPTRFFEFNEKVYMINGTDYKSWDGITSIIEDVDGYIPKLYISTQPIGGGTFYEGSNLLTGSKHMTFNGDGTSTNYQIVETDLDSVDTVYVEGVEQTVNVDYTVNLTTGIVTFTTAPLTSVDNVDIYWTKGSGNRDYITGNKYFILFGPQNDTRVFLYGHPTYKNRIRYSDLGDLVPSVEYFPATNFNDISSDNTAVTNIDRQYDKMIINKKQESYYSFYESVTVGDSTLVSFPVLPLNQSIGMVAYGQGQVVNNNPITLDAGIQEWVSTSVRDERNVKEISFKINRDLENIDLSTALTVDFQEQKQYWLCIGKEIYIYSYNLQGSDKKGVYSKIELSHTPTCFVVIDDELYFGTDTGLVMKFSQDFTDYNDEIIDMHWESHFIDFEAPYLRKTLDRVWISLQPQANSHATIGYKTDRVEKQNDKDIEYSFLLFDDVDFRDFSFKVNINPQMFRLKMKAKKFTYFKLLIDNDELVTTAKILEITMRSEYGSESK